MYHFSSVCLNSDRPIYKTDPDCYKSLHSFDVKQRKQKHVESMVKSGSISRSAELQDLHDPVLENHISGPELSKTSGSPQPVFGDLDRMTWRVSVNV